MNNLFTFFIGMVVGAIYTIGWYNVLFDRTFYTGFNKLIMIILTIVLILIIILLSVILGKDKNDSEKG